MHRSSPARTAASFLIAPFTLGALLALAPAARADVPPPGTEGCRTMAAGQACVLDADRATGMKKGACHNSTCPRRDYAHWDKDASAMPPIVNEPCLVCEAPDPGVGDAAVPACDPPPDAAPCTSGTGGSGAGGSGAGGNSAGKGGAGGTGAGGTGAGGSTVDAGASSNNDKKDEDSGCSLGGFSGARAFGPWALAGSVGVALFFTRRRRR